MGDGVHNCAMTSCRATPCLSAAVAGRPLLLPYLRPSLLHCLALMPPLLPPLWLQAVLKLSSQVPSQGFEDWQQRLVDSILHKVGRDAWYAGF